jgi:hypothetical protein
MEKANGTVSDEVPVDRGAGARRSALCRHRVGAEARGDGGHRRHQRIGQSLGRQYGDDLRTGRRHRQGDAHGDALKGAKGNVVDIVAGDEVRNFDQIKLGDFVVARYTESLTLELRKTKVKAGEPTVREGAARAQPGERPAVAGGREITAIADVIGVDPKKSTITLKGPRGNVVTLDVHNPDQFKVVKKGDQVEVTYTEALAGSVEPAPKPAASKK